LQLFEERKELKEQLTRLLQQEELKWIQRVKDTDLKEGKASTKYFDAKANGRHRRNTIVSFEHNGEKIAGQKNLEDHITKFYKELFGQPQVSEIQLNLEDIPTIDPEVAQNMTASFSMEEIENAVFEMAHNKSAGSNGFPIEFYQKIWDLIKHDLKALVDDFQQGKLDIERLNYGVITLVPKCEDPNDIKKFRPEFQDHHKITYE
jgi:hypothetical protein